MKTTQDTLDVRGDLIADLLTPEEREDPDDVEVLARALDEIIGCDIEEAGGIACELLKRFRLAPRPEDVT